MVWMGEGSARFETRIAVKDMLPSGAGVRGEWEDS